MKVNNKAKKKEQEFEEKDLNGVTLRVYPSGAASINIATSENNSVVIKGWIRSGKDGSFFAFPSHKYKDEYYNDAYVMGDMLKATIETLVAEVVE